MKKFYLIATILLANISTSVFAQLPGISPEPTTASSNASYTAFGETSLTLSWNNGDGATRIVFARASSPVDSLPKDGTSYTASSTFGNGTSLGANQFAVYSGTGSNCQVSNLNPETVYYFSVFEFNGSNITTNYLTSSKLSSSRSTLAAKPTLNASQLSFSNIDVSGMDVSFLNGNGTGRIVIARESSAISLDPAEGKNYIANSAFGSGSDIGGGIYVVYSGNEKNFHLSNLNPGKTYYLAVYEYNGSSSESYNYLKTSVNKASQSSMFAEPSTGSTAIKFSNPSESSLTISWNKGNGSGRIIVAHTNTPVNKLPTDGETYTANNNLLDGTDLGGGNYVVYNGTGNSATITGLSANTTYHFSVSEYNGSGNAINYYTNGIVSSSRNTLYPEPTLNGGDLTFSAISANSISTKVSSGNGNERLIVVKKGSPIDQVPQDGVVYSDNSTFGSGQELIPGSGCYVVFKGTANNADFTLTNLEFSTSYYFSVFEYNGTNAQNINYKTTNVITGLQGTLDSKPTTPAQDVTFSNVTGNSITVAWKNGSGSSRILIARAGDISTTMYPKDGHDYTANATFGKGSDITSGTFVVFNGTGSTVDVKGLSPNTTYYFAVFEYNGSAGSNTYSDGPIKSKSTLISKPTAPASNIAISPIQDSTASITWSNGNGTKRLVIVRENGTINKLPDDGQGYTQSPVFGKGSDIGSKNFVVYSGTGSSMQLQGLTSGKAYYVTVIEFNGEGTEASYLSTNFPMASNLPSEPQVVASNMAFEKVDKESIKINWTNGDGAYRLLIARESAAVNKAPADGNDYAANDTFARSTDIGFANYVVYNGSSNSTILTGLKNNMLYHFALFEYNKDIEGPANYAPKALTGSKSNVILAIGKNQNIAFTAYPNPTTGILQLQLKGNANYRVLNFSGQEVAKGSLIDGQNQIDLQQPAGSYYMTIIQSENVYTLPISIIQ